MGRKLTASEETQALISATRAAHEVLGDLNRAIAAARRIEPGLVAQFEQTHSREIKQLSNFFTEEANRQSASLNAAVEHARQMIKNQIMSCQAVLDADHKTITITWGAGGFDDNAPPPYPQETTWKDTP